MRDSRGPASSLEEGIDLPKDVNWTPSAKGSSESAGQEWKNFPSTVAELVAAKIADNRSKKKKKDKKKKKK